MTEAMKLETTEEALRNALAWYGEQARLARLIHSEGDPGRWALAEDGGKRACEVLALSASPAGVKPLGMEWEWRSRIKGGAWDAWESGRYGGEVPPFMDVEERKKPRSELVWVQNLKGFIEGKFPADERWKKIFLEKLDHINDATQSPSHEPNSARIMSAIEPAGVGVETREGELLHQCVGLLETLSEDMPEDDVNSIMMRAMVSQVRAALKGDEQ